MAETSMTSLERALAVHREIVRRLLKTLDECEANDRALRKIVNERV